MNAALKQILVGLGVTGANAIPVAGQLFGVFAPIVAGFIQKHQAAQIATGQPVTIPSVEELTATLNATLDSGDAEWAAWVASHPKP